MSTFVCEHEFDLVFIAMCSRNPMYSSVFGQNLRVIWKRTSSHLLMHVYTNWIWSIINEHYQGTMCYNIHIGKRNIEGCVVFTVSLRWLMWWRQIRNTAFSFDGGTRSQLQHKIDLVGSNSNASGLHSGSDGTWRLFIDTDFPDKYFVVFLVLSRKIRE